MDGWIVLSFMSLSIVFQSYLGSGRMKRLRSVGPYLRCESWTCKIFVLYGCLP